MPKSTSVVLAGHLAGFVQREVAAGHYASASDVVNAGLRLLEERDARLESLRDALIEGEKSGPSTAFDVEAFIARKRGSATPT